MVLLENSPISWSFILGEGERKLRNETRWKDDIYCGFWRLHEFSVDNQEIQIIILAVTIVPTLRPSSERQLFASSLKVPGSSPTIYGSDFTWYQTCECELTIS